MDYPQNHLHRSQRLLIKDYTNIEDGQAPCPEIRIADITEVMEMIRKRDEALQEASVTPAGLRSLKLPKFAVYQIGDCILDLS